MQCLQIDEPPARWIFSSEHLDMMAFLSDSSSSTCHLPNMSLLDLVESMALSVLEESEEEQEQDERQVPAYSWDPWNSRLAGLAENGRLGTWFSESTWEHVD